jgi:K+-transporting ATPase KdpF subunit
MSTAALYAICAVIVLALLVYLVFALLRAEVF